MSEQQDVQQLLKQGIEAAREGKKAEARELFQKVVELDEKNEKGWFWLASLVESDEERRICLTNVLQINPSNERAQKALDKLEANERERKANEEVIPGVTQRQLTLYLGGGVAVVVVILIIFVLITSGNNARVAAETQAAQELVQVQTSSFETQAAMFAAATGTRQALVTDTPMPTNTSSLPTLPPENTATAQPSPSPTGGALFPPPPANLTGSIIAWSGQDIAQRGFLPIVLFPASGGPPSTVGDVEGRDPTISQDGQRVIYTRYFPTTSDFGVEQSNVNGSDVKIVSQGLSVLKAQMPSYCPNSNLIAFAALPSEREIDFSGEISLPYQVYTLNMDNNELKRLTNDQVTYTYPAFSPDCTRIAVIRNDERGPEKGADLIVIEVNTLTQTPITTDRETFVEAFPHWSPDGSQLAYSAHQAGEDSNNDIFVRPANGSGVPLLPVRDPADDIMPVFSGDGRYLAFSSNRGGNYDIYIFDQVDNNLFQLNSTVDKDFPGGWSAQ